jgi:hypothetical protein
MIRATTLLASSLFCIDCSAGSHAPATGGTRTEQVDEMQAIRNDTIQFATFRPPDATLPTRGRQVMVVAPPEAVALARSGNLAAIDRLLPLLGDPDRAWAAEVMLAAMTGHDADLVNDFQREPKDFLPVFGQGLKERWQTWLDGVRDKLKWDEQRHRFVVK